MDVWFYAFVSRFNIAFRWDHAANIKGRFSKSLNSYICCPLTLNDMKKLNLIALAILVLASCNQSKEEVVENPDNPFYGEYETPYGVPPFAEINNAHYMPAFEDGMKKQLEEVDAIANSDEEATFENTIEAFEKSGELLSKVVGVFYTLTGAHTNDSIQENHTATPPSPL